MSPGPRSTSIPSGILIHPTFGHNRHGPKSGGAAVPLSMGGGAGSSSNSDSPGKMAVKILCTS